MRNRKINISDFYCTQCGHKTLPIPRKDGQGRELGHLKNLYCPFCRKKQNCVEIRQNGKYTYQDFLVEFTQGNFDANGKRIRTINQCLSAHRWR